MHSINFTVTRKVFCLSLHFNGANSYLYVNGKEMVKLKAKNCEIVATPLCLGDISNISHFDWSVDNMKRTGLNGYVYEFSVDYRLFDVVNSVPILHKYLMAKYNIN